MKRIYSTRFDLGGATPPAIDDVIDAIEAWLLDNSRRPGNRLPPKLDYKFSGTGKSGPDDNLIETARWASVKSKGWAFRWMQPETGRDNPAISTEIILRETDTALNCSVHVGYSRSMPKDGRIQRPLRPKVVPVLISKFDAMAGLPATSIAEEIREDKIESFISELRSPDRQLPVILLSHDPRTGELSCRADLAAEILAGIAHVRYFDSEETSFLLTDRVGKGHSCFGGCAKLYWPGWAVTDDPLIHRLFWPDELAPTPAANIYRGANRLLAVVAAAGSAIPHPRPTDFDSARLELDGLEHKQLLSWYDEAIAQRDQQIKELAQERESLRSRAAATERVVPPAKIRVAVCLGPAEKGPRRDSWDRRFQELLKESNKAGVELEWEFFSEKFPQGPGHDYWILDAKTFKAHKDSDFAFQKRASAAKAKPITANATTDIEFRPSKLERHQAGA